MTKDAMRPGEHSHSDRPNWRPAKTIEEYLSNVREGLEKYSIERLTALYGLNRTHGYRCRQLKYIPEGLFDRLVEAGIGLKQLAHIGTMLRDRNLSAPLPEVETCPHCGGPVRVRRKVSKKAGEVVQQWVDDGMPNNTFGKPDLTDAFETIQEYGRRFPDWNKR